MRSTLWPAVAGVLAAAALTVTATLPESGRAVAAPQAATVQRLVTATAQASTGSSSEHDAYPDSVGAPRSCERTLNVVAHEDDDLLFLNPAVSSDIAAGRCVVTLFVTAGDAGRPSEYWHSRELGAMAAYAAMAHVPDVWRTDSLTVAGHTFARVQLKRARVSLLFLRLPDAHRSADRPLETLERLWRGGVHTIYSLDRGEVYTRQSLIGTVAAIMDRYQPDRIRTLDYAGRYGDGDHADHHTVGYLTYAAQRAYRSPHRIVGYMGYPVAKKPENLSIGERNVKLRYFLTYAPYDTKICQTSYEFLANFYAPRFSRSISTGSEIANADNLALDAQAHASSANTGADQVASKAIDGTVAGAPAAATHEWATLGVRAGSWIRLTWNTPQDLDEVDLFDRPNPVDRVTAGVLEFSDGTSIRVGSLPNGSIPKVIHFGTRTVWWLRFTVTAVSRTTRSVGLAEIRAYGPAH